MNQPITYYKDCISSFEDRAGHMFIRLANMLPGLEIGSRVSILEKLRRNLLNEQNSHVILKFLCYISGVSYDRLLSSCYEKFNQQEKHIDLPKLLCHLLCMWGSCFSDTYMSKVLELDVIEVQQLISHLRSTFTIDNPIMWLQGLAAKYERNRLSPLKCKQDLMHGLDVVNQPVDTREDRRIKNRNLKKLSPYIDN